MTRFRPFAQAWHIMASALCASAMLGGLMMPAAGEPASETISVEADRAKLHRLARPASTIIIGNPTIADVSVQSGTLLVITGKNFGSTNMIVLDREGAEIAHYLLHVKSGGLHQVTVHNGDARVTLNCAPRCEPELQIGDSNAAFETTRKKITGKDGTARSATGRSRPNNSPDN